MADRTLELFDPTESFHGVYSPEGGDPVAVSPQTVENLAHGFGHYIYDVTGHRPTVIVGGDTGKSTLKLRAATITGLKLAGAEVWQIDTAPTPVIAWLAQRYGVAAVAISTGNNPATHNGFTPFMVGGEPVDEPSLANLEKYYWDTYYKGRAGRKGKTTSMGKLRDEYLAAVVEDLGGGGQLGGRQVLVDGANGAAYSMAPRLYRMLGADVVEFACRPKAKTNHKCGAANLEGLRSVMTHRPLDTTDRSFIGGIALDGSGERIKGMDAYAQTISSDHLLYLLSAGQPGVVGTVHTNSGLRQALEAAGIALHETTANSVAIANCLRDQHLELGAEPSGRIVDTRHLSTSDGMFIGAKVLIELQKTGATLADLANKLILWPEAVRSVTLRPGTNGQEIIAKALEANHSAYGDTVRAVITQSDTQPRIDIWVEADPQSGEWRLAGQAATRLYDLLKSTV